jgi:4-hydroxy-tetrahydrodipicolinate synthase
VTYFGRVITALVTPLDADLNVNYAEAEKLAVHLAANGSDGIVVCGTTGESPTITWEEEYELFRVILAAVGSTTKIIAGTGSNSTKEAIEATSKAAKLGVHGSLQVVPYYNKPTQAGLLAHFKAIAAACDLPVMLYNIPGRTGQMMEPETSIELSQINNIVATKEAAGNLEVVSQIRRNTPADFKIYSGDDALTLPTLAVGGDGIVSVASHLVGNDLQQMVKSFQQGDHAAALAIHLRLIPLFRGLFSATNPIPIKAALNLLGWNVGGYRLPLLAMSEDSVAALRQILQEQGLLH